MEEEEIKKMTPEQAKELITKIKEGKLTSIPYRDFYALKKKVGQVE